MRRRGLAVVAGAIAAACAALGGAWAGPSAGAPSSGEPRGELASIRLDEVVFSRLVPVDEATYQELQRLDPLVLGPDLPRQQVLDVTLEVARDLLDELIAKRWGALHWFAHPGFRRDARVLYYSKDSLTVLDKEYVIPTIFPPSGRTRADLRTSSGVIRAGTYFEADGLLLGRGRLAVWYPLPPYIRRTDPPYDFRGGRYDLHRVNVAQIASPPDGGWVLDRLQGRNHPAQNPSGIGGPFRMPVRRIDLAKGREQITVWGLFGIRVQVEHPLFAHRTPPLYARPPEEVGVPADVLERARQLAQPGADDAVGGVLGR